MVYHGYKSFAPLYILQLYSTVGLRYHGEPGENSPIS